MEERPIWKHSDVPGQTVQVFVKAGGGHKERITAIPCDGSVALTLNVGVSFELQLYMPPGEERRWGDLFQSIANQLHGLDRQRKGEDK